VFAVLGALTLVRPQTEVYVFPLPVALPLYVAVVGLLLISAFLPNVSWEGHLGGLLAGVTMGYLQQRRNVPDVEVRFTRL
jgi:membrane associated rhomboid family serine protease